MISASLTFSVSSKSERSIKNKFFVTRQHFEAVTKLLEDFDKTINVKNEGLKTLDLLQQSIKMSIHNFPTFLCRESFITRLQKQVTKINIDDNFLSEISDDISIYENLLILNASRNCIRRVSSKIGNCKKLNRLILDTNEIEELPFEIGLLQELTYVHLERNRITNFPLNLTQCVHLKMLDLSINELEELPKEIGNLVNLEWLNLSINNLNSLPQSIGDLAQLEFLDISANNLPHLPDSIGNLKNLKDFRCQGNRIRNIPKKLAGWTSISIVQFSNNEVEYIPDEVLRGWSSTVRSISFGRNRLTEIPESIGLLTKCFAFTVIENAIEKIPGEIGYMENLAALNISENKIGSIPEEIGKCRRLAVLYASNNKLTSVPSSLGRLKHLQGVYVSRNPIQYFPASFKRFKGVMVVDDDDFASSSIKIRQPLRKLQEITATNLARQFIRLDNMFNQDPQSIHRYSSHELSELISLSNGQLGFPDHDHIKKFLEKNEYRIKEVTATPPGTPKNDEASHTFMEETKIPVIARNSILKQLECTCCSMPFLGEPIYFIENASVHGQSANLFPFQHELCSLECLRIMKRSCLN